MDTEDNKKNEIEIVSEHDGIEVEAVTVKKKGGGTKVVLKKIRNTERGFWHSFKDFINKGNIIQLAVAFVMGGAFGAITKSLVDDIFMPFINVFFGEVHFEDLKWQITSNLVINYGIFISNVIYFLLVSLILFLVIQGITKANSGIGKIKKQMKKAKKGGGEETVQIVAATPTVPLTKTEELLSEIKDLLSKQEDKKK